MLGVGLHAGLGVEGNAETGFRNHRQVVGSVAHGDCLGEVHFFHLGNEFEQFGLAVAIHYFAHIVAGEFAVVVNLEFVGIHIVDAIFALEVFSEEGESSAEDGNLIAIALEHSHQSVNALGDGQFLGDVLHHAHVEPLEQCHSLLETLLEVNLSSHCPLGDFLHFVAHSGSYRQFVDTLRLDERGVHIKADESAHAAEHVVALQ